MPNHGVGSWPARRARINPEHVAFRQDDRVLTYAQLAERVQALATALAANGVGHGDRVAWLGANDIAAFEIFFASTSLGAVFVPLNTRLAAPEVAYLLSDCAPRILFHSGEHADTVAAIDPPALGVGAVVSTAGAAPGLDGFLAAAGHDVDAEHRTLSAEVGLSDAAVILYTSGTTGKPKGAVLSHANLTFNTMNQLAHADVLSTDTALCISPLFHATGLGQVSLPVLFKGGAVVVVPRFDAAAILAAIAQLRIATFSCVPTMLQLLADHDHFADTDLSSLRYVIYGGSPVLERVASTWQRRGVTLLQGYGMTEASPGVYMATADGADQRPTSIGLPHFFTDVSFDPATQDAAPTGSGELFVRGLNVFSGYWNRPEDTEKAFVDGWYRTGDVISVGADGWAYVVDRIKDMIISGGENIYPSEVEAAIAALPGVLDCALVATPDERWGEVGTAWVVASPDASWTAESLRAALSGVIAAFKIPKYVNFVPELPRTATGKVRKPELRIASAEHRQPANSMSTNSMSTVSMSEEDIHEHHR